MFVIPEPEVQMNEEKTRPAASYIKMTNISFVTSFTHVHVKYMPGDQKESISNTWLWWKADWHFSSSAVSIPASIQVIAWGRFWILLSVKQLAGNLLIIKSIIQH